MFYPNELASLIFGIIAAAVVFLFFRKERLPRFGSLYAAFLMILAANFFTVIEGALWGEFFNILEHLCYAAAGLLFVVFCWSVGRLPGGEG